MSRFVLFLFFFLSLTEGYKKKSVPINRKDLPFIKCPVCENVVKQLVRSAKVIRESAPKSRLMLKVEEKLIKLVENVCDPKTDEGEWISKYDIVAVPDSAQHAKLEEQSFFGKCKSECHTIARSCEGIVGDYDIDIAELLQRNIKRASVVNHVCHKLTKSCGKKSKEASQTPC